jgi:uncharacterized protein with PhoU and TrkA domain
LRIRSDATSAGQTIRELPLSDSGIAILAVSRGGRIIYEPKPDFRIFPSDRLLLMGQLAGLKDAESILNKREVLEGGADDVDRFEIAEIKVAKTSDLSGKSLIELLFRQRFGATLVGIRRGEKQITTINPAERLQGDDCLIVIGKAGVIEELKKRAPV